MLLLVDDVAIGAAAAAAATAARGGDDGEVVRGDDGVSDLAGHAGPGRDRKRGAHCAPVRSNSLDNNNSTASCCFYISLG